MLPFRRILTVVALQLQLLGCSERAAARIAGGHFSLTPTVVIEIYGDLDVYNMLSVVASEL